MTWEPCPYWGDTNPMMSHDPHLKDEWECENPQLFKYAEPSLKKPEPEPMEKETQKIDPEREAVTILSDAAHALLELEDVLVEKFAELRKKKIHLGEQVTYALNSSKLLRNNLGEISKHIGEKEESDG